MSKKRRGSITVEAAIALPVFLCVVFSFVSLIKIVYTYEMIQYSLAQTADEMASSAYLFRICGLQDLNSSLSGGLESKAQLFESQIEGYDNLSEILTAGEKFISEPLEELKSISAYLGESAYGDLKTNFLNPLAKLYMKKNLAAGENNDIDKKLKALNIENGFDGLNFDESQYFSDKNENIDIIVRYTIALPVPINVLPKLVFVQRATSRAWLGGDDPSPVIEENSSGADIWTLDNFTRGRIIRNRFGANLPSSFPVIAAFENGKAVMIKSLDTTAVSYQSQESLKETLEGYISSLVKYNGQVEPWGSKKIIIKENEILQKELILVIPENELTPQAQQILEECAAEASAMGVNLVIKRYEKKDMENTTEKAETETPVNSEDSD